MRPRHLASVVTRASSGVGVFVVVAAMLVALQGATCANNTVEELPPADDRKDIVGPGDVVDVHVFNEPDLTVTVQVAPNGTVRLPLIENIPAAGLTTDELALRIEQAYNERYLKNAEVTLRVVEANSRKVYVLGQVARPGPYVMKGKMTLIDAIAIAGGTTKLADSPRTRVTREKNGKQVLVIVNVSDIERGLSDDVELVPGDIVYVPESIY